MARRLARDRERGLGLVPPTVPRGVMVAREILDLFVKVRVLARQPTFDFEMI
jgi:hypothetical protein